MGFFDNNKAKTLFIIMSVIAFSGIVISYFYYKNLNESTDPRILKARKLYENYNVYALNNDFDAIFSLMDSIERIYADYDHYKNSYEIGVLHNNRAASWLTMALYVENIQQRQQDSLLNLAEISSNTSIENYQNWLEKFQGKNSNEIEKLIYENFLLGLEGYNDKQKNEFLLFRIKEIEEAQTETKRRLSVSYTNLGIIERHKLQYNLAARHYKKAIELWDRNLSAENNLNILLGRPLKKRSFIQKLFPPEKD